VGGRVLTYHPLRFAGSPATPMSKKKDCFGSETYVCRTTNCSYMSECVKVVWEKKLKRILARRPAAPGGASTSVTRTAGGVTMRARDFLPTAERR
jgi:hypothetical protein